MYVLKLTSKGLSMCHVEMVKEYLDVFSYVLPKLRPYHKTNSVIDVVPVSNPISYTPYRWAVLKMEELRNQLYELIDCCFIRLYSSPRGEPILFVKKKNETMCMYIDYCELKNHDKESVYFTKDWIKVGLSSVADARGWHSKDMPFVHGMVITNF